MADHVGRILTVDRVRELNAKDWFYQILKDSPRIHEIYPGIEDAILEGAIDHHIHVYPDFVQRNQDMIQVAVEAARAGMRSVCFKDHYNLTAGCAYLVQRQIDDMVTREELPRGVEVYGGIGLNFGMNPEAVRIALQYPKCKMVWFPTFNSSGYYRALGKESGINLVDKNRKIFPDVVKIMELAAEGGAGVGFGHTDFHELLPLAQAAKEVGARAILDHPLLELNKLTLDEMKELADLGTYVGTYCQPMIPSMYQPVVDPFETPRVVEAIGAERCIAASDFGQLLHVDALAGMRIFIRAMLAFGIGEDAMELMFKTNPARLLYLD
ncbi:MAG: DUF6282 family protein [Nitrospinota bacterium]|jgi:hypothetical protein|nr:DUF6282 family protein [Nitrospinota bacterium]MDP7369180.1 DUF6282 family protein [Nitrospinota bacterium]MDP7503603.1 DUF6282 family protein [Nitrospinota bacterium]MDP7663143.1 DUF6282 family protein [Nitrospinota bacterium]HJP13632.1 DUF6282 family protein [Nitrospinota bacterium]